MPWSFRWFPIYLVVIVVYGRFTFLFILYFETRFIVFLWSYRSPFHDFCFPGVLVTWFLSWPRTVIIIRIVRSPFCSSVKHFCLTWAFEQTFFHALLIMEFFIHNLGDYICVIILLGKFNRLILHSVQHTCKEVTDTRTRHSLTGFTTRHTKTVLIA